MQADGEAMSDYREHGTKTDWCWRLYWFERLSPVQKRWCKRRLARNRRQAERRMLLRESEGAS
jgi:hypothetical protein